MGDAFSARGDGPRRHPALGGGRDAFRELAERQAAQKAARAAQKLNRREQAPAAEPEQTAAQPVAAGIRRLLANGTALRLVSSRPEAARPREAVTEAEWEERSMFLASGSAALAVVARPFRKRPSEPLEPEIETETQGEPQRTPMMASALTALSLSGVLKGKSRAAANDDVRGRRGGGGGKGGDDHTFDQDDLMTVIVALLMLLLLLWIWISSFGRGGGGVQQLAASEPVAEPAAAERADPFGAGPVDLRPTSPLPEAAPAPAPVEVAPVVPEPAPSPPTVAAAAVASTPADAKPMHAYFCTARSSLTADAKSALEAQIATWKTQAAGREIVVTGFADTRGATDFNAQLAASRADFVAGLLRAHGLSVIEATGVGELEGLDDGVNCANQRRVDIAVRGTNATPSRACGLPQEVVALSCS